MIEDFENLKRDMDEQRNIIRQLQRDNIDIKEVISDHMKLMLEIVDVIGELTKKIN